MDFNQLFVISGGPGAGKTTLLEALGKLGYRTVAEDARKIIQEETLNGGDALPWKDKQLYSRRMFGAALAGYQRLMREQYAGPVFLDRGIMDVLCYMEMEMLAIPAEIKQAARNYRYNRRVFMPVPWAGIYHADTERRQTWDEAVCTFRKMQEIYQRYGYQVRVLPEASVASRVEMVISEVQGLDPGAHSQALVIVKAGLKDLPALRHIARTTFVQAFAAQNDKENMQEYLKDRLSAEQLSAELSTPESDFYFARIGEQIAGYLKLNRGTAQSEQPFENAMEIERIYVLEAFQGKRIGQALLEFALNTAKQHSAGMLWLGVWEANHKAQKLYQKNGFTVFDRHIFRLGAEDQTDLLMKLPLAGISA